MCQNSSDGHDLRLSTLQAYARALGGRLQPVFVADENGKRIPIAIRKPDPAMLAMSSKASVSFGGHLKCA